MAEREDEQQGLNPQQIAELGGQLLKRAPSKAALQQAQKLVAQRAVIWVAGIIAAAGGGVILVFFFLFLAIIIVAIVVVLFFGAIGGTGTPIAEAAGGGDGTGIISTYCQVVTGDSTMPCSTELEKIFEAAGAFFKVPAGVLVGVASIEGPQIFSYSDDEILAYSADSGGSGIDGQGIDPANSTPNGCGAVGPMQFLIDRDSNYPAWVDTCENPAAAVTNVWGQYKTAVNIAKVSSISNPDARNIRNAIYGAAWKLKCDSGAPADECASGNFSRYDHTDNPNEEYSDAWEREDVDAAAGGYYGACVSSTGYEYCQTVWDIYVAVSDYGSSSIPSKWPTSGWVSQGPYSGGSHSGDYASSVDIDNDRGTPIFSTQSGVLIYKGYGDINELYVAINGADANFNGYVTFYVHLDSISTCIENTPLYSSVPEGELVGYMGDTGDNSTGHVHLHYMIHDAHNQTLSEEEFRSLLPDPNVQVGDNVTTNYTGVNCHP